MGHNDSDCYRNDPLLQAQKVVLMEAYPKVYLYKRIVQAKMFIDQNYARTINLNDIADEAIFSKFHFIRQFKQIYGKTPHQYLVSVRIAQAKYLLNNSEI